MGGRLKASLKRIEEPYVLHVIDDNFPDGYADTEAVEKVLNLMEQDSSIAAVQLRGSRNRSLRRDISASKDYEGLKLHQLSDSDAKTEFYPTIWRKEVLMKWLRSWESIWGFESLGSARAKRWHYPEKVYAVDEPLVFGYFWTSSNCSAIVNGKWIVDPYVEQYLSNNQIDVDLSRRGRITLEEYGSHDLKYIVSQYNPLEIIQRIFWRILSFF